MFRFPLIGALALLAIEAASATNGVAAEDEAMARAKRQAEGPMRIILQSSLIRRGPVSTEEGAPRATEQRPVATRASQTAAPRIGSSQRQAAKPPEPDARAEVGSTLDKPASAGTTSPFAATPVAVSDPDSEIAMVPPAASLAEPASAPASQEARTPTMPVPSSESGEAEQNPARRLLSMVEPDIPAALLYRLGNFDEVMVDASVRPDGTVSNIDMLPPAPRQLARYLIPALKQWRFEPASADSRIRLQLVVRPQ